MYMCAYVCVCVHACVHTASRCTCVACLIIIIIYFETVVVNLGTIKQSYTVKTI